MATSPVSLLIKTLVMLDQGSTLLRHDLTLTIPDNSTNKVILRYWG